jgi:8-oxo-dGTP diphosphatase
METRVRVAALTLYEDRVLLVAAKSRPPYLIPPGGGVEAGETLSEAAEREVREEAEVEVVCGALLAYRQVSRQGQFELELFFAARPEGNPDLTESISGEDRRVAWVQLNALEQTPHFPEQLAQLCERAAQGTPRVVDLGPLEL